MHPVTIRMDRVFDVQPDAFSQNIRRTLFSFESSGKRYFSVLVVGSPNLQSGQTITAVLANQGDWQTVRGIRIHESGEVCAPNAVSYIWLLLLTVFTSIVAYMELVFTHPTALVPVLAIHALLVAYLSYCVVVSTRIRLALRH